MAEDKQQRIHVLETTERARACSARLRGMGYRVESYSSAMEVRIDEGAHACDAWVVPLEGDGEKLAPWLQSRSARIVMIDPCGRTHRAYESGATCCASTVEGVAESLDFICNGFAGFARPQARSGTRLVPTSRQPAHDSSAPRVLSFPSRS